MQQHAQQHVQQLPPACGARQLSKLKRFMTTIQQFGTDISPQVGEHVRNLCLALVNSHVTVEEFHAKLQQAINFPMRPFIIPFVKVQRVWPWNFQFVLDIDGFGLEVGSVCSIISHSRHTNLPLLQRELMHCSQIARQFPHLYFIPEDKRNIKTLPAAVPPVFKSAKEPIKTDLHERDNTTPLAKRQKLISSSTEILPVIHPTIADTNISIDSSDASARSYSESFRNENKDLKHSKQCEEKKEFDQHGCSSSANQKEIKSTRTVNV